MGKLVKYGLILGIICLVASLVLAVTYKITKPEIQARIEQEEKEAMRAILPEADSFNEKSIDEIEYFEGYKGEELVGYCVKLVTDGYAGYIHMIVGIDGIGIIKGVRVISHQETPGLGSRIVEIRHGDKEPWFLRQFKGEDARTISIEKIDAITGATISSESIVEAINKSINEFLSKIK